MHLLLLKFLKGKLNIISLRDRKRIRWRSPKDSVMKSVEMAKKFVEDFQRLEYELQSIMNRFDVVADEDDTINL